MDSQVTSPIRNTEFCQKTVIATRERGTVVVSPSDLFSKNGNLRFLPDALDRSRIQINQGGNGIHLKIGGIIGRLPVTENLVLDISPKFPIGNLARLLSRSDQVLNRRVGADRLYDFTSWTGYLPELLLRSFAIQLRNVQTEGVHRNYIRNCRDDVPRPKIDFRKSEQAFWARGIPTRAKIEAFDFSTNNAVNRILKAALLVGLSLTDGEATLNNERQIFAENLKSYARISAAAADNIEYIYEDAVATLPHFKIGHHKALEVARELIRRSSPLLEFADRRVRLPSFIINLDTVFESYIRNCLRNDLQTLHPGSQVNDGNEAGYSKSLLNDNQKFTIKPDLIFRRSTDEPPFLIGDLKYKTKPTEDDRYQILTHTLSYQCKKAILIYPKRSGRAGGLIRIGQIGPTEFPIELFEYHFDLSSDLEKEEQSIAVAIGALAGK